MTGLGPSLSAFASLREKNPIPKPARLNLPLRSQMLDALADDLADIGGVETVGNLNPLGAQLGEFLIDPTQA